MTSFLVDNLVVLFLPWRILRRVPEQAGFGFLGRHTLSGLLIYPTIIGAFSLMVFMKSHEPKIQYGIGGEGLSVPQAGLMAATAKGLVSSKPPPMSEWLPRALICIAGWLVTGMIAGFVTTGMISGLLVMVLLAGGQEEPGKLSRIWRLSSISTQLLPVAVIALVGWVFAYADRVMGIKGGGSARIALAMICSGWASAAFWLIGWATLRQWTSASRIRSSAFAVVFAGACWLVVLMGNFIATQPLHWLGIGFPQHQGTSLSKTLEALRGTQSPSL